MAFHWYLGFQGHEHEKMILNGLLAELAAELKARGFNEEQLSFVQSIFDKRFNEYSHYMDDTTGAGPMWHLHKHAYWNIIGEEKEDAIGVFRITAFLSPWIEICGNTMKKYNIKA